MTDRSFNNTIKELLLKGRPKDIDIDMTMLPFLLENFMRINRSAIFAYAKNPYLSSNAALDESEVN